MEAQVNSKLSGGMTATVAAAAADSASAAAPAGSLCRLAP
jgi:hypothetical protein